MQELLFIAIEAQQARVVEFLLEENYADCTTVNTLEFTPIEMASFKDCIDIFKLLLRPSDDFSQLFVNSCVFSSFNVAVYIHAHYPLTTEILIAGMQVADIKIGEHLILNTKDIEFKIEAIDSLKDELKEIISIKKEALQLMSSVEQSKIPAKNKI